VFTLKEIVRSDAALRTWAYLAIFFIGLIYVLPDSALRLLTLDTGGSILLKAAVALVLVVVVLGFYFAMFFECGFGKVIFFRGFWLVIFIFIPLISAFIYFFVTRSATYREYLRRR